MAGYSTEDIFEPAKWIDANTLAGSDETAQCGSCSTAHITVEEQPVVATDHRSEPLLLPVQRQMVRPFCSRSHKPKGLRRQCSFQSAASALITDAAKQAAPIDKSGKRRSVVVINNNRPGNVLFTRC